MNSTRVYVIDDSSEMRLSLHYLLTSMGMSSWPFAGGRDFLDQLDALVLEPAPILLDVRMPEIDGIGVMNELLERGIDWPVVIMTGHAEVPLAVKAMKLGALDLLEKPFDPALLATVLETAFGVASRKIDAHGRSVAARERINRLTPREKEVVARLAKGAQNKTVAHELGVSVRTAEMHRANALSKLEVKSLAELVGVIADAGAAMAETGEQ